MYYTAAGGVVGGVVVGYLASDSALGLRVSCDDAHLPQNFRRCGYNRLHTICRTIAIVSNCRQCFGLNYFSVNYLCCFLPLIPASSCAKFPPRLWV
jgi:hypothetical protein